MRKLDLVHIHALGIELAKYIAREEGCEMEDLLSEYEAVDISGPHDVRAQKATQKAAVFALLSDITSTIESDADVDVERPSDLSERELIDLHVDSMEKNTAFPL